MISDIGLRNIIYQEMRVGREGEYDLLIKAMYNNSWVLMFQLVPGISNDSWH